MPLTLICPVCNDNFTLKYDYINKIEDTYSATMDCKNSKCNALLYSHEMKGIVPFHEYMNEETNGQWPKDGKGTGYMEINEDEWKV